MNDTTTEAGVAIIDTCAEQGVHVERWHTGGGCWNFAVAIDPDGKFNNENENQAPHFLVGLGVMEPDPNEWDLEIGPEFYPADYETVGHMPSECTGWIRNECPHPLLCEQLEALAYRMRRMNWTPDTLAALIVATTIQARDIMRTEPDKPRRVTLWEAIGFVQAKVAEVSDGRGRRVQSLTFVPTGADWAKVGGDSEDDTSVPLDTNTVNDLVSMYLSDHEQNDNNGPVFPLAWEG